MLPALRNTAAGKRGGRGAWARFQDRVDAMHAPYADLQGEDLPFAPPPQPPPGASAFATCGSDAEPARLEP